MNERSLPALIVLNLVLLLSVVLVGLSPSPAQAQFGGSAAEFTVLAGDVKGRDQQAMVYVVDLKSSKMAAFFFNSNTGQIEWMAARVVADDITSAPRSRR